MRVTACWHCSHWILKGNRVKRDHSDIPRPVNTHTVSYKFAFGYVSFWLFPRLYTLHYFLYISCQKTLFCLIETVARIQESWYSLRMWTAWSPILWQPSETIFHATHREIPILWRLFHVSCFKIASIQTFVTYFISLEERFLKRFLWADNYIIKKIKAGQNFKFVKFTGPLESGLGHALMNQSK